MSDFFQELRDERGVDIPADGPLLGALAENLDRLGKRIKSVDANIAADFARGSETIAARVASLPLAPDDRPRVEKAELDKLRTDLRTKHGATPEAVDRWLRDLNTAERMLTTQEKHLASDAAAISRATLPDPTRATYAQNLAQAGPGERRSAYEDALIRRDAALAAALLQIDGDLPRDKRVLTPEMRADLAAKCLPHQVIAEREHVANLRRTVDEARRRYESVSGTKPSSLDRISRGLRAGQATDGKGRGVVTDIKPTRVSER